MWTNVLLITGDAVKLLLVPTYVTASTVPVFLVTPVMASPAQVKPIKIPPSNFLQRLIHLILEKVKFKKNSNA